MALAGILIALGAMIFEYKSIPRAVVHCNTSLTWHGVLPVDLKLLGSTTVCLQALFVWCQTLAVRMSALSHLQMKVNGCFLEDTQGHHH